MVIKTFFMFALYFIPYGLMIGGAVSSVWPVFALWLLMGLGKAGIGLSVMHDANHGSYSRHPMVNKIVSYVMNMVGGSSINWQIQHNILHHSFTNVDGLDEDIDAGILLRFSPNQKRYPFHRAQWVYAWFFYGLMTIMWATTKDFRQLIRYKRENMIESTGRSFPGLMTELIISKILYYGYVLIIPLMTIQLAWWQILLGFLAMHFVAGFTLACIFQPAHVMQSTEFPTPDKDGNLENTWAIHQLMTTTNFAPASRLFSWFIGGLNYQIEHHLFPNICHVHYRKISRIVRETAEEYGLPYHSYPTFVHALWNHGKMLWQLGLR